VIRNEQSTRSRTRLMAWLLAPVVGAVTALGITSPAQAAPVPCDVTSTTPSAWVETKREQVFPAGFTKEISVHNVGTQRMYGWDVYLTFTEGVTIDEVWNAESIPNGSYLRFRNAEYDRVLAPGRSTSFGLKATVVDQWVRIESVIAVYAVPTSAGCSGHPLPIPRTVIPGLGLPALR